MTKWFWGILVVMVLSSCLSVQRIGRNQELLKEFQAPAGVVLGPSGEMTVEGGTISLGGLRAVATYRSEAPDFWTAAANELVTKADLKRVVVSYQIGGGDTDCRLDIVADLYRAKTGGGSWLVRKPTLYSGSPGQRLPLEYSHVPGGEVLVKMFLGSPFTVKLYYNGIPRSGGWTDLFNSPTALFVDGDQGLTYLTLVGVPQVLEPVGQPPAGPRTQTALLLGHILLESEKWTIEDWERSIR